MKTVGVRELRNNVSEVLRHVEAGTHYIVTNQGREVADITPHRPDYWQSWDDVADIFTGPDDPTFLKDVEALGPAIIQNPWDARVEIDS